MEDASGVDLTRFRLWYAGRKQPPWSNLYFAIGTAHWEGPGKGAAR